MRRLVIAAALLTQACASRQDTTAAGGNATGSEAGIEPVVTLERAPCFGSCPVYRVWVSADGTVGYEGKAHVRQLGRANGKIGTDQVQALLEELDRAGYTSLAASYTPGQPTCGRSSTDSPSAVMTVRLHGKSRRVEHYYGCASAPGSLIAMEQTIDRMLNSSQWTGR